MADELCDGVESVGIRLLPSLAALAGLDAWKKDNTLKGDDKSSLRSSGLESGYGHFQHRPLVEKKGKKTFHTRHKSLPLYLLDLFRQYVVLILSRA